MRESAFAYDVVEYPSHPQPQANLSAWERSPTSTESQRLRQRSAAYSRSVAATARRLCLSPWLTRKAILSAWTFPARPLLAANRSGRRSGFRISH